MLREAPNATFVESGWLVRRRQFRAGRTLDHRRLRRGDYARVAERQQSDPVPVMDDGRRRYWWFHDRFWWEDDGLGAADVRALVLDRERRARRRLERAHSLMRSEADADLRGPPERAGIPQEVKRLVWERCGGRCVECGSDRLLEFDHVIPLAMGGSSNARNLQLLCADCNRSKGDSL